jgi:hypothetical protein
MPRGSSAGPTLAQLASTVSDWRELELHAATAQLRPPLAAMLEGLALRDPGALEARARLQAQALAHAGRARLLAAELVRILEVLAGAGIVAAPFKGPAFAQAAGLSWDQREMNDLDLLVAERDLVCAVEALAALGYSTSVGRSAIESGWLPRVACEVVLQSESFLVELHWRLAPPWFPEPVGVPQVFARLAKRDFFGASVSWPAPEELLLAHVADGMKAGAYGLRWVGDLAAIVRNEPGLDWSRVQMIARQNRALDCVRIALAVIEAVSELAAGTLDDPRAAVPLAPAAQLLAAEARGSRRLAAAVRTALERLAGGVEIQGAIGSFAWAMRISDSPLRAFAAVASYLAGPSVTDLAGLQSQVGEAALRARALRRRLGLGA